MSVGPSFAIIRPKVDRRSIRRVTQTSICKIIGRRYDYEALCVERAPPALGHPHLDSRTVSCDKKIDLAFDEDCIILYLDPIETLEQAKGRTIATLGIEDDEGSLGWSIWKLSKLIGFDSGMWTLGLGYNQMGGWITGRWKVDGENATENESDEYNRCCRYVRGPQPTHRGILVKDLALRRGG
ncbi:hypothetical protein PIIN_05883 [Serendipita indica DSM 11827]|uniref:Uncharacterized protein n=1 Tax=Serendipita indica (strain DSM 11827) TaxID=1109443 RepID=G4TKV5_SERID|nr:hypothetical protein PIIN_05883 [Serendipita indica DSM 11827]